jgi:hypothetical protein
LGIAFVLGAACVALARDDAPAPLSEVVARTKVRYDRSRAALAERGIQARTTADANDYAGWVEANDAYVTALLNMELTCDAAVGELTSKSDNLAATGFKPVLAAMNAYLDAAPPVMRARLQLRGYANLLARLSPADRKVVLEALVPVYFTGE